jgi:pimeloyl-ACP methyl ester carboxylesterase
VHTPKGPNVHTPKGPNVHSPNVPSARRPVAALDDPPRVEYRTVHGYRRAFVRAGSGPALLLVHGIGDSADTWRDLIGVLASDHTVIAPDLLGHGRSDKPRADYSVAAYANGMRDLLGVLGVERVTIVGHSLGGGVAMQFAYQYPERVERLVLVGTGGVGRQVNPTLRLASLPGADLLLHLLRLPPVRLTGRLGAPALRRLPLDIGYDIEDLVRIFDALPDGASRSAVVRTLRAVVDWRGQVVTMLDRCYLARGMPTLLVWGRHDTIVPVEHAHVAHAAMPNSRLEIFDDSGHFPHHSEPARFVAVLQDFLASTHPSSHDLEQWRTILRHGRSDGSTDADAHLADQMLAASNRTAT